jgi:hypothetical protein
VEHVCHHCGVALEDGIRFCSGCGAPQIRVTGLEPTAEISSATPIAVSPPIVANRIDWSKGLPAAATAGLSAALFSLVPIVGIAVLLWMLVGGSICVVLYRRRMNVVSVTAGMGAKLGAASGLIGFVLYSIGVSLELLLLRGDDLRNALRQAVVQAANSNPDPRAQEFMQRFTTPEGLALLITLTLVMFLFVFIILGGVGGALWASLGARERR